MSYQSPSLKLMLCVMSLLLVGHISWGFSATTTMTTTKTIGSTSSSYTAASSKFRYASVILSATDDDDNDNDNDNDDNTDSVPETTATTSSPKSAETSASAPPKPQVKCPDCDLCDGSGRILGGLGAVLPWMPVKAYRPCPNFVDRGGFYQRSGQGLDEIAFGRDSKFEVNKDN